MKKASSALSTEKVHVTVGVVAGSRHVGHGALHLVTRLTPTSSQFRQSLNTRSLPTEHCDCPTAFAKEQKLVGTAPVNALWLMNLCENHRRGCACMHANVCI